MEDNRKKEMNITEEQEGIDGFNKKNYSEFDSDFLKERLRDLYNQPLDTRFSEQLLKEYQGEQNKYFLLLPKGVWYRKSVVFITNIL